MEVKFENLLNIFPNLNPQEQREVQSRLANTIQIARQNISAEKRPALAEAFFNLLEPERRKQLEVEMAIGEVR